MRSWVYVSNQYGRGLRQHCVVSVVPAAGERGTFGCNGAFMFVLVGAGTRVLVTCTGRECQHLCLLVVSSTCSLFCICRCRHQPMRTFSTFGDDACAPLCLMRDLFASWA